MERVVCAENSVAMLADVAKAVAARPNVSSLLVFLAEGAGWDLAGLSRWAQQQTVPLLGGIFPHAIADRTLLSKGGVVVGLKQPLTVFRTPMNASPTLPEAMIALPEQTAVLTLIDGLSPHVRPLVETLYDELGPAFTLFGGGAGSLSLTQQPCLISNHGVEQRVALFGAMAANVHLSVRHGWQPLEAYPILVATETDDNRILSLDWQPAFTVYRHWVERHASVTLTPENFFSIAKAYPLGIIRPSGEFVVRDPIRVEGETLVCVGPVQSGSSVAILHGDVQSLLNASREIGHALMQHMAAGFPATGRLLFDCVSRVLFLNDHFFEELDALIPDALPTAGALTLGEIAFTREEALQFYNKTSVGALIAE